MLLRFLLALIDVGCWLAPPSRRREWRRQWRADILHEWQWIALHPDGSTGPASLVVRTIGALRHAFWLRRHVRSLEMITQDIRYGWRLMLHQPAFTAIAVLTLGLGIGANVTIYSWVQALLLNPMPKVATADRFVSLSTTTRTRSDLSVSWPNFVDMRARRPASAEDLLAYTMVPLNLRTGNEPERVWGLLVSGNYFDVLGLTPALGRGFDPDDRAPEANPVAVFSYAYWQRHFSADPAILGRSVTLNGRPFTVVGIAPEGFRGNAAGLGIDVFVPMMMQKAVLPGDRLGTAHGRDRHADGARRRPARHPRARAETRHGGDLDGDGARSGRRGRHHTAVQVAAGRRQRDRRRQLRRDDSDPGPGGAGGDLLPGAARLAHRSADGAAQRVGASEVRSLKFEV